MEPLDLKKFAWNRDHAWYTIVAITDFQDQDVVVHRANETGKIEVSTVDDFCREFTAVYQLI